MNDIEQYITVSLRSEDDGRLAHIDRSLRTIANTLDAYGAPASSAYLRSLATVLVENGGDLS